MNVKFFENLKDIFVPTVFLVFLGLYLDVFFFYERVINKSLKEYSRKLLLKNY